MMLLMVSQLLDRLVDEFGIKKNTSNDTMLCTSKVYAK